MSVLAGPVGVMEESRVKELEAKIKNLESENKKLLKKEKFLNEVCLMYYCSLYVRVSPLADPCSWLEHGGWVGGRVILAG